jgi:ribosomal protein L20
VTALEAVDVTTGELVTVGGPMTPAEASDRAVWVREVTAAALTLGVDYGQIPGTGTKPALLKPGAEMLLLAAGLGFTMEQVTNAPGAPDGVTYRCSVHRATSERVVAQCEGFAGYDEPRFFQSAEERTATERTYANKDQRPIRPDRCTEYRAPWNTLAKMAQKRALVGAALNATAASGLFVADVDDDATAANDDTAPKKRRGRPPKESPAEDTPTAATTAARAALAKAAEVGAAAKAAKRELLPGEAELEARILANETVRVGFRDWRASKKYEWPSANGEIFLEMTREVDRLYAEAERDDAYEGSTPDPSPPTARREYEPPVGSPFD